MEAHYKGTKIEIKIGDLLNEDTEAIVNPANSLMIMGGGVAGAIKNKGGKEIEQEAMSKAPVEVGKAIITNAGRLKAKYVVHSPTMERPAMLTNKEKVYLSTKAALQESKKRGIRSIAFPAMGTGVGGVSYIDAASAMLRAIKEELDAGATIQTICIVLRDEEAYEDFINVANKIFS
ncbi:MAG TPA: macro domain-containing protein [Geobacterales bacterium]|nr:macro domain-containing protein [Geobacterales bacterium]